VTPPNDQPFVDCTGFVGSLLPYRLWRIMPRGWAVHLHRSQKVALLPLVESSTPAKAPGSSSDALIDYKL